MYIANGIQRREKDAIEKNEKETDRLIAGCNLVNQLFLSKLPCW